MANEYLEVKNLELSEQCPFKLHPLMEEGICWGDCEKSNPEGETSEANCGIPQIKQAAIFPLQTPFLLTFYNLFSTDNHF